MNAHLFEQTEPVTAAEWFAARRARQDEQLERRFSTWLAADPRHFEDYALCELTWELTAHAAAELGRPATVPWYRRRIVGALAAGLFLACMALSLMQFWPARSIVWTTKAGEQRSLTLQDGSHITMNTRSTLEVRMGRGRRDIRVIQGEAFFEVAHDPSRPFVIDTSIGTIRAVGTRFDVLLDAKHLEVNMEEGKVMIHGAAPGSVERPAAAGVRARLTAGSSDVAFDSADLTRVENWREHRIEFDRVPLAAALSEFSRYTALPIRAQSPQIARLPISALFKTGDINALRATLKGAFGLTIVERNDELIVTADPAAH